jgi:hypothetical protein
MTLPEIDEPQLTEEQVKEAYSKAYNLAGDFWSNMTKTLNALLTSPVAPGEQK